MAAVPMWWERGSAAGGMGIGLSGPPGEGVRSVGNVSEYADGWIALLAHGSRMGFIFFIIFERRGYCGRRDEDDDESGR